MAALNLRVSAMDSLLLLLLVPFGAAAMAQLFDDSDHDDGRAPEPEPGPQLEPEPEPEPQPEPEPEPDTILEGTEGDDTLTAEAPFTEILGLAGDDTIAALGTIRADGGAGDDLLRNSDQHAGSSTLSGGEGDDTIRGNDGLADYAISESDMHWWHTGKSDDRLDGGAGNDKIYFDLSDTVSGGDGEDKLEGFVNVGHLAVVTDFDPAEDRLVIDFEPDESREGDDWFGNVSFVEVNGDTVIRIGDSEVTRIEGQTGLTVGYETNMVRDHYGDTSWASGDMVARGLDVIYTDLDGNEVDPETLDVVLNAYLPTLT